MLGYALRSHGFDRDYVVIEVRCLGEPKSVVLLRTLAEMVDSTPCWVYAIRKPTAADRRAPPAYAVLSEPLKIAA